MGRVLSFRRPHEMTLEQAQVAAQANLELAEDGLAADEENRVRRRLSDLFSHIIMLNGTPPSGFGWIDRLNADEASAAIEEVTAEIYERRSDGQPNDYLNCVLTALRNRRQGLDRQMVM